MKVGDVVKLKSSEVLMTVEKAHGKTIECVWFDANYILFRDVFMADSLEFVRSVSDWVFERNPTFEVGDRVIFRGEAGTITDVWTFGVVIRYDSEKLGGMIPVRNFDEIGRPAL